MDMVVINKSKTEVGKKKLPVQFSEEIRPDLIRRAVLTIQANSRQPYGSDPRAGLKHSADLSRRRRKYRGSYGLGISRVPRKVMSRRGTRLNYVGAEAPGTVGGRRAHPPKVEKNWSRKINIKERRKAIRSALAATVQKGIVQGRGHKVPPAYPFIIEDNLQDISKTRELQQVLEKIGLKDELGRCSVTKIRAGKGKLRGRKYKKRKGPLLVVSGKCALQAAAKSLPGVDVVLVHKLNAEHLAPGTDIGRLTIFTASALERLREEGLFTNNPKKPETKKPEKKLSGKKAQRKLKSKKAREKAQKKQKKKASEEKEEQPKEAKENKKAPKKAKEQKKKQQDNKSGSKE
jgi:large subunit ribosomal protein L4e